MIKPSIDKVQEELFKCELTNWPVKDDIASMEIPLFGLTKQKDTEIREYHRGNKTVRIIPSGEGTATIFDKDLLIYIASQIVQSLNAGKPVSRVVHINSTEFLQSTARGDGRASFERIIGMLRRLKGTIIETNIPTGGKQQTKGFSIIDDYDLLSEKVRIGNKINKKTTKEQPYEISRALEFTITLSEWFYNSLINYEVLTLNKAYFRLTKPIERRLYEIARKHCGDQSMWKINIDLLSQKIGIERPRFKVREELRKAIKNNNIPEYCIGLDTKKTPDDVVFYTKDRATITKKIIKENLFTWFTSLERHDN